ncbi:hypothetical protein NLJ89_g10359 [Agrocybe chaxingu]|uniref:Uncharacterized protein n=1 Tax=Agrocybe chaxingu TaxID=84603 RepID=A0A9W8MR00_9AGAR|nr:hypothetical protein NLJ89_g10359 [Agrocybe chaxingu]
MSQEIVCNHLTDLRGALYFLSGPQCASATGIILSNLHWDILSQGGTMARMRPEKTPRPRPSGSKHIHDMIDLHHLTSLSLSGNDPFTLLSFINPPPFLASLTITTVGTERRWTDNYAILADFLMKYARQSGPPKYSYKAYANLVSLRLSDDAFEDFANGVEVFCTAGVAKIQHVELRCNNPHTMRSDEEYAARLYKDMTKNNARTYSRLGDQWWALYQNHAYEEAQGRGGRLVALPGLHFGWHKRWDEGRKEYVPDKAFTDRFLRLEWNKGCVYSLVTHIPRHWEALAPQNAKPVVRDV